MKIVPEILRPKAGSALTFKRLSKRLRERLLARVALAAREQAHLAGPDRECNDLLTRGSTTTARCRLKTRCGPKPCSGWSLGSEERRTSRLPADHGPPIDPNKAHPRRQEGMWFG